MQSGSDHDEGFCLSVPCSSGKGDGSRQDRLAPISRPHPATVLALRKYVTVSQQGDATMVKYKHWRSIIFRFGAFISAVPAL